MDKHGSDAEPRGTNGGTTLRISHACNPPPGKAKRASLRRALPRSVQVGHQPSADAPFAFFVRASSSAARVPPPVSSQLCSSFPWARGPRASGQAWLHVRGGSRLMRDISLARDIGSTLDRVRGLGVFGMWWMAGIVDLVFPVRGVQGAMPLKSAGYWSVCSGSLRGDLEQDTPKLGSPGLDTWDFHKDPPVGDLLVAEHKTDVPDNTGEADAHNIVPRPRRTIDQPVPGETVSGALAPPKHAKSKLPRRHTNTLRESKSIGEEHRQAGNACKERRGEEPSPNRRDATQSAALPVQNGPAFALPHPPITVPITLHPAAGWDLLEGPTQSLADPDLFLDLAVDTAI
ncbi:hypothetical protein JHW43_003921 [Diplocarpon mali]|nr:hypothetical protein JHW43_003921 [Diplocarpon mali]